MHHEGLAGELTCTKPAVLLQMHIVVGDPLSLVDLTNGLSFTTIG